MFQHIADRNPVFSREFHTTIGKVVFDQLVGTPGQISSEGEKTLPAVTGNTLVIDGCDMSNSHLLTQAYSDKIMIAALVTISFYAILCLQCSGKVW